MYNETTVTLQGRVGGDVQLRSAGGTPVTTFRVACTPRRKDRETGDWADGPTQWYSVSAWRWLAEHCAESLRRGDAVIVHGRIDMRTYVNKAGVETLDVRVEAVTVGHDLSHGTSTFHRPQPVEGRAPAPAPTPTLTPTPAHQEPVAA